MSLDDRKKAQILCQCREGHQTEVKNNIMNMYSKRILTFAVFFILWAGASTGWDDPRLGQTDKSESRTFILENGLRVLLVQDPDLNTSAASMSVGVGSFADTDDALGIAHFLEHMLFLGTEKFPDEADYGRFLRQNGGYSNAYTASDHTNYHFEVYDHAFEGALDRFSQFFIAPLFDPDFTEREINAVHSEYQANIEDDRWRIQSLINALGNPEHPRSRFLIGSRETLQDVSRETLLEFYDRYYSANQMALSLVSSVSLDQMEQWVRYYFAGVENRNLERPTYPMPFVDPDKWFRFGQMRPIQERRNIVMVFNLPSIEDDWDAKTSNLISHIIGHEGEGSLLSVLKDLDLASGIGASIWAPSPDYSILYVSVELTPNGRAQHETVAEKVLGYLEMMRQNPFPHYIHEEMRTMLELEQLYADRGEGARRAVALANNAYFLPLEYAAEADFIMRRADEAFYYKLLEHARPRHMIKLLVARDVETDQVDPWFGTEYQAVDISGAAFERFNQVSVHNRFTLPAPNPFIPESVAFLAERPVKLIDRDDLTLFFGQDTTFQRPQLTMHFRFRPVWDVIDARQAALLDLYAAAFNEAMNETGYSARMAGASYSISTGFQGITLSISGYTGSVEQLSDALVKGLKDFELEPSQFEAVHDRLRRAWESEIFGQAFRFIRDYQNEMAFEHFFRSPMKAAELSSLGLEDVLAFRDTLFSQGRLEALIYGNSTADHAIAKAELLRSVLDYEALPPSAVYRQRLLEVEPGEQLIAQEVLPSNNSVFRQDIIAGLDTPERRMLLNIVGNLIEAPYFTEMRTRQQLGYVVWSGAFSREDELNLLFLIQSGDYDPLELKSRSDAMLADLPAMVASMPEEAFIEARDAVRSQLLEKPTSIAEKAAIFFNRAFVLNEDWDRQAEALEALEGVTREAVIAFLSEVLDPDQIRSRTVYLFARQHGELADQIEAISNIQEWKEARSFRELAR